jgi:hypothetical protein
VLIVEAIDLDVYIFTSTPWWAPTVVVYENDLEYGWSQDRENDGNIGVARVFRQVQASRRIIALYHVFLCYSCQLMLRLYLCYLGVPLPSFYVQGARVTRKVLELVTIVVLVGLYL